MPLTDDVGVIEPNKLLTEVLIKQFKVLLKGIESLDKVIKKAYKAQDDIPFGQRHIMNNRN
jgi:hypothetical protein